MRIKLFALLITMSWLMTGCNDEAVLQQSVFVNDPQNPGLPKYSEVGYNTFGAYYDRLAFTSSEVVPIKVIATGGNTSFKLIGTRASREMAITLTLVGFSAEKYSDLLALDNVSLDLKDSDNAIEIEDESTEESAQILNGTFHFKRAQHVLVDAQPVAIVLSGTFEFQALVNGEPITVSNGRFDVGVGTDNFFAF